MNQIETLEAKIAELKTQIPIGTRAAFTHPLWAELQATIKQIDELRKAANPVIVKAKRAPRRLTDEQIKVREARRYIDTISLAGARKRDAESAAELGHARATWNR